MFLTNNCSFLLMQTAGTQRFHISFYTGMHVDVSYCIKVELYLEIYL